MSRQETLLPIERRASTLGAHAVVPATLNIAEAATYLGIAKSTLYTWRTRRPGFGPRAVKAGGALRYRRSDLDAWIDAHAEARVLDPDDRAENDQEDVMRGAPSALVSLSRQSRPRRR